MVSHKNPPNPPEVKLREIIPVNPNSRESVKHVIQNIMQQCKVGQNRQWIRIGSDVVPFNIVDN